MALSVYASLLALLYIALSVRTLLLRRSLKIGIGDGGNKIMTRAMRVHSNFSEYVPIALILALLVELSNSPVYLVHLVCASLLAGRCLHAYGVSKYDEKFIFRIMGMALTFTSIGTSAALLLLQPLITA